MRGSYRPGNHDGQTDPNPGSSMIPWGAAVYAAPPPRVAPSLDAAGRPKPKPKPQAQTKPQLAAPGGKPMTADYPWAAGGVATSPGGLVRPQGSTKPAAPAAYPWQDSLNQSNKPYLHSNLIDAAERSGYNDEMDQLKEYLASLTDPKQSTGSGSGNMFNYGGALNALMGSGIFNAVPAPTMQAAPAPIQMAATQLPQFQQWTPQMLAAPDFSGQYGNIDTLAQQTRSQIDAAFAPALAALSTQIPTSIGAVAGTAQNVDPGLQAFAESQGVGAGYAADLAAANQGIQSNADLFSGRNQMLDRVFQQNRANTADIARQSQAGALSNVATQEMLATAALDQIAQQAAIQNAEYNNQLVNNAGQFNSQGLNNWALTQAGFNNDANTANTAALNAWLQSNTDVANQNAMLSYEGDSAANTNRLKAILDLISSAATAGVPMDLSALGMVA